MTFRFTDDLVHEYATRGVVVLRRILPISLVRDLRREADKGRDLAREFGGENAQRLQPIKKYADWLSLAPFYDYAQFPPLVEACRKIIAPDVIGGGPDYRMGILYEPATRPWCTMWHRDFGPLQQRMNLKAWPAMRAMPEYFHQVNCALYEDACTWYVPGSHLRDDFPEELHLCRDYPWQIGMDQTQLDDVEVERFCRDYVGLMPRAERVILDAGDFMLYRNSGFHLGCYTPYKRRATLHDSIFTPAYNKAIEKWNAGGQMEPVSAEENNRAE